MRRVSPSGLYAESTFNSTQTRATSSSFQYGGCAAAILGNDAHSARSGGQDPTGLGRWVWIRLRGKKPRHRDDAVDEDEEELPLSQDVIVVSAYRPCDSGGESTPSPRNTEITFWYRDETGIFVHARLSWRT